ncbi:Crp/Fnr family transcriptional regulator [Bdellovibrionota bacterium FG-1]
MATPVQTKPGPQTRRLKKGDLLFSEGENSRAMYFLKAGVIRLFKKKGDSDIELDTIHSGQVLGELAFLDGNPRSASGEALTECDLVEISVPTFQEVLARMPDWLKIMLKTVVGRLRTASTRIRQLETASTSLDYSDKDGKRATYYVYMNSTDVTKIASGILLVASRNGKPTESGTEVPMALVQRYVNQVIGIPVAKITTLIDILSQNDTMNVLDSGSAQARYFVKDIDFLERLIGYLNEENLVEPSKCHNLSLRGFIVMNLIAKHLPNYKVDPATGTAPVNIAEIRTTETQASGKEPFRIEDFQELVRLGYLSALDSRSATEIYTQIKPDPFFFAHRCQRIVLSIHAVNEQKRNPRTAAK